MTGAEYEYLAANVHLYQEGYLKKCPGLWDQENYTPPMPTAPQTLKTHLAHRGTHTNKSYRRTLHRLTSLQTTRETTWRDTTLTEGQRTLPMLKHTSGTLSGVRPCLTTDTTSITVM